MTDSFFQQGLVLAQLIGCLLRMSQKAFRLINQNNECSSSDTLTLMAIIFPDKIDIALRSLLVSGSV